ncbi:MAG: fluoride efflux transporter CrcB [Bacteroidales bacterium]|nr:fluoride efflux transporter CrcB [Bacteroidales bacterium]
MIKNFLWVMGGGALGAAFRYGVGLLLPSSRFSNLPIATFAVNIVGCLLLGILIGLGQKYTNFAEGPYLLFTVGLCGAFTTFSTFTADTFRLMEGGNNIAALGYLILSIVIGFLFFFIGRKIITL